MNNPKGKVEGLAILERVSKYPHGTYFGKDVPEGTAVVALSQAEAIIAAKDVRVKELSDLVIIMTRWMPSGFGSYPDEKEVVKEIRKVYNGI